MYFNSTKKAVRIVNKNIFKIVNNIFILTNTNNLFMFSNILKFKDLITYKNIVFMHNIWESNRIRTVPEYGHSLYLRNHKSYNKMFNE